MDIWKVRMAVGDVGMDEERCDYGDQTRIDLCKLRAIRDRWERKMADNGRPTFER
jgi:hypothetical protein